VAGLAVAEPPSVVDPAPSLVEPAVLPASVVEPAEPLGEAVSRPGAPFGDGAADGVWAGAGEGVAGAAVAVVVRLPDACSWT
jgi:hypothetical protein